MSEYIVKLPNGGAADECIRLRGYEKSLYGYELHEEIVRCRDCVHYTYADKEHGNDDWCKKHEHIAWSVNGFCAWGERLS